MRRSRLGLVAAIVLIALLAVYTAGWWIIAGRIKDAVAEWTEEARSPLLAVFWQSIGVDGFPLAFRLELSGLRVKQRGPDPTPELRAPALSIAVRPWNLHEFAVAAPGGLDAWVGPEALPLAKLAARTMTGTVAFAEDGSPTIRADLGEARVETAMVPDLRIAAESVALWVVAPARMPQRQGDRNLAAAAELHRVALPAAPAPFGNTIDVLALGVTVTGPIPAGPPREAATAWRDAGGTVELDRFQLGWGPLAIAASGTLALDHDLQPAGRLTGSVAGYGELLAALVSVGVMKSRDAGFARMALGMLAKPGPDGRPRIAAPIMIQNGEIYLGPAKLGRAPRISW